MNTATLKLADLSPAPGTPGDGRGEGLPLSPQSSVLSPKRRTRRAFTLIEILAVIGVILILMALFFGGMKKWSETSKRQLTVTRLEVLQAALNELEAAGHNTFQQQWFMNNLFALDASQFGNVSVDIEPPPSVPTTPETVMFNGNPVALPSPGFASRQNAMKYMVFPLMNNTDPMTIAGVAYINSTAPTYTYPNWAFPGTAPGPTGVTPYGIMARLMTLPTASKAISALGAGAIVSGTYTTKAGVSFSAPVVLDGWGNPIVFVPAGGIGNVYLNTGTNSWTQPQSPVVTGVTTLYNVPITAPDNRPFFVSAGSDGDFLKGDDNIYSFEAK